jgi:hypothetical protein
MLWMIKPRLVTTNLFLHLEAYTSFGACNVGFTS